MRPLLSFFAPLHKNRLASATFYGILVRLSGMALAFVTGLVLARILGKAEFGIYGIVISAAGIAATAALVGAPYLAVREIARAWGNGEWSRIVGLIKGLALMVTVIGIASALLVMIAMLVSAQADAAMVAASWWVLPFVPAYALAVLAASCLRGTDRPVQAQSVEVLFRPLLLLALIPLALFAGTTLDAAAAIALTTAATLVSLAIGTIWIASSLAPRRPHWGERPTGLFRKGLPFAAIDVLRQLDGAYPLLILGAVATNEMAGSFRVGQLGAMLIAVPYTVIGQVMSPAMAQSAHGAISKDMLRVSARAMFGLSMVGLAAALLVGEPLIAFLFGPEYADAWLPLVILCAVQCVNAFFGLGPVLLILAGEERPALRIYAFTLPVALILAWFLAQHFGAAGAALAVLAGTLLSNLLTWRHARTALGVDTSTLGRKR